MPLHNSFSVLNRNLRYLFCSNNVYLGGSKSQSIWNPRIQSATTYGISKYYGLQVAISGFYQDWMCGTHNIKLKIHLTSSKAVFVVKKKDYEFMTWEIITKIQDFVIGLPLSKLPGFSTVSIFSVVSADKINALQKSFIIYICISMPR